MGNIQRLRMLLFKNFLLERRRWKGFLLEILFPVILSFILMFVHSYLVVSSDLPDRLYPEFSVGKIPFSPGGGGSWRLAYAPNTSIVTKVLSAVKLNANLVGFDSEESLVHEILEDFNQGYNSSSFIGGLVFTDLMPNSSSVFYKIRLSFSPRAASIEPISNIPGLKSSGNWFTENVYPLFDQVGPRTNSSYGGPPYYYEEGFLSIQNAVDTAIIEVLGNTTMLPVKSNTVLQRYPYPSHKEDMFLVAVQMLFPAIMLISYIYPTLCMVRSVVHEKERKLKESMRMIGLSNWMHWLAWYLSGLLKMLVPSILITVAFTTGIANTSGSSSSIVANSSASLFFVYILLFMMSSISFSFLISSMFNRAIVAAVAHSLIWLIVYSPYGFIYQYYSQLSTGVKIVSCSVSTVCMALGANLIGKFEIKGAGIHWGTLFDSLSVDDGLSFGHILIMLFLDTVFYLVLTFYIEAVFPGEIGIAKPWYFLFTRNFWRNLFGMSNVETTSHSSVEPDLRSSNFEVPAGLKKGIVLRDLTKVFQTRKGPVIAVDSVSCDFYRGQISVLLGHNGAGKSTTMSMLTGLLPPTSGMATVEGYNINTEMNSVRRHLGVCPQHSILFDNLSVEEHLWLFAILQGVPSGQLRSEIDELLGVLALVGKRHAMSKTLSGGMKRRLSIGMSLIGKPDVVLLDEPTAGMDPMARRFVWDLLRNQCRDRTILMTTHHMDEAEILGDRVAIMSEGCIQCCGSPLFLKKQFGLGYHLTITTQPSVDKNRLDAFLLEQLGSLDIESRIGHEHKYRIREDDSPKFPELFHQLETSSDTVGVVNFGVSMVSLKEVFIGVVQKDKIVSTTQDIPGMLDNISLGDPNCIGLESTPLLQDSIQGHSPRRRPLRGLPLLQQQFAVLVRKCWLQTSREHGLVVVKLVLPLVIMAITLMQLNVEPTTGDSPVRYLNSSMYRSTQVVAFCESKNCSRSERYAQFATTDYSHGVSIATSDSVRDILNLARADLSYFNDRHLVGATFRNSGDVILWFNNQAYHVPAVSLNTYSNYLWKEAVGPQGSLTVANHPLPKTLQDQIGNQQQKIVGFTISFNLVLALAFVSASVVFTVVQERVSGVKKQMMINNLSTHMYWAVSFLWNLLVLTLFSTPLIPMLYAANLDEYQGERLGLVFLLLLMFHAGNIPFMYLLSNFFSSAPVAFTTLAIFNVLSGTFTQIIVNVLEVPSLNLTNTGDMLQQAVAFLPTYSLSQGISNIATNYENLQSKKLFLELCYDTCRRNHIPDSLIPGICQKVFDQVVEQLGIKFAAQDSYISLQEPGIGIYILSLGASCLLYVVLLLAYDSSTLRNFVHRARSHLRASKSLSTTSGDEDVLQEERMTSSFDSLMSCTLLLRRLKKVYSRACNRHVQAVESLSFVVNRGECFGLLGLNGAGKTTTMKMLIGDEEITSGEAYICGKSVSSCRDEVLRLIGYCPQFDAQINVLTGKETLTMYAGLRGIRPIFIPDLVSGLAGLLKIEKHMKKQCSSYSGGTSRKLSLAVALIGDPPLLLLDEPTTGTDPLARQFLLETLSDVRKMGKAVVLISHTMEECEALCTKIGILVNGTLQCIGTPQQLKCKFGQGYTVIIKLGTADSTFVRGILESQLIGCTLKDEHYGYLHYRVQTSAEVPVSKVFSVLTSLKQTGEVENFSVSQTTLEEIFLEFSQYQITTD